jgi:hypothetical protein
MNKKIAYFILSSFTWAAVCNGVFLVRAYAQQGDIISTGGDPAQTCAEAKAAEEERHRSQLIELQKAEIDATKDFNNRLLMCKADKECRESAREELDTKRRNIQAQRNEVNAEYAKRLLDIGHRCQTASRQPQLKPLQPKLDPRDPNASSNTPTTWTDVDGNKQPMSNRYVFTSPDGKKFAFPRVLDERSSGGSRWVLDPTSIKYTDQKKEKGDSLLARAWYHNQSGGVRDKYGVLISH